MTENRGLVSKASFGNVLQIPRNAPYHLMRYLSFQRPKHQSCWTICIFPFLNSIRKTPLHFVGSTSRNLSGRPAGPSSFLHFNIPEAELFSNDGLFLTPSSHLLLRICSSASFTIDQPIHLQTPASCLSQRWTGFSIPLLRSLKWATLPISKSSLKMNHFEQNFGK